jgi:hypothetical protein
MHLTTFVPDVYTFQHWAYIDMFVYFSHARVTIPPTATIQAAHINGVEVYGTLIMEWDAGAVATRRIVEGRDGDSLFYAKKLVEITDKLGFEGWLVNIEHSMPLEQVDPLVAWIGAFKDLLNDSNNKKLIWYDSILNTGELKWQSALNDKNYRFFPVSDLFFTDYHWVPENIRITRLTAGEQNLDRVLMGVDVWGRGSYGGGGWDTSAAIKEVLTFNPPAQSPIVIPPHRNIAPPLDPVASSTSSLPSQSSTSLLSTSEAGPEADSSNGVESLRYTLSSPSSSLSTVSPSHLEQDSKKSLGVAIFAPGWTIENQADSYDSLSRNEDRFWQGKGYWNVFSTEFEKSIQEYFRQYLLDRTDPTKFSALDILGPFEYSTDGAAGQAEKEAAKFSTTTPNAAGGRFPGIGELFDPRTTGSQWAWRHLRFDIIGTEITPEYMDRQPEITLSVWFKGNGPMVQDLFRLRVLLVSAINTCIAEFDSGTITCTGEWTQLRYVWRGYGAGVRSIVWVDGGKDAETWAGHFGCTIDRPTVWIPKPEQVASVGSYIKPRVLQNASLPFISSFDIGQGTALYSNGSSLDYKMPNGSRWYNMASQSPMPTLQWTYEHFSHFHMPSDSSKPPIAMDRRTLSRQDVSLINYIHGNLVDASEVDGGVYHGSSCLKLEGFVSGPSPASSSSSSSSTTSTTSGDDNFKGSGDSISSVRRRKSSMKLLFETNKAQNPSEHATLSLYPLSIDSPETSITLRIVFRTVRIPSNAMVLAKVTRSRKSTGSPIEPLSWDMMNKDHRDQDSQSSLGWTNFVVSWTCEADTIYDGVSLTLVALQHSLAGPAPSSPRFTSPRGSLVTPNSTMHSTQSSSSIMLSPASSCCTTTPTPEQNLVVLVGFVKVDQRSLPHLSTIPSPPSSNPLLLFRKQQESPLGLNYKLTWSRQSLFSEIPVWTLTAFWNTPPLPPNLSHLGPPHFIITATVATTVAATGVITTETTTATTITTTNDSQEDVSPTLTAVLCQGRTWNPSWVLPGLIASGEVTFTVSTVFPDFSQPSHLIERIKIAWPN